MDELTAAVDRIENRYRARFAGHPRVSRDPEDLAAMITELDSLAGKATDEALKARIASNRESYARELEAIRDAIAVPFALAASRLRNWTDLSMSRYQRSFAGKDRRTRDLSMLEEILDDLKAIRTATAAIHEQAPAQRLDETLQRIDRVLPLYSGEVEQIRAARRTGSLMDQGSRLATLANDQFARYTRLFAAQSRLSRHPRTLERILVALEEIRRSMQSLKLSGFVNTSNDRNIVLVDERLRAFRKELTAIREAQHKSPIADRISSLAAAANQIFNEYRDQFSGKPRSEANPDVLDQLFERLWPVAREMDQIDDTGSTTDQEDTANERNLRIVVDNLVLYAREYDAVRQARGEVKPQPQPAP